ncbi:TonB-dependent receptor [Zoogloea sp.]|uniref:TonB-dependent receptor plug domain-containing protein n=1 Tax=Zoogloea sp. TaxID=49181 RepID=UPI001AC099A5|nr:TonB-dependent receptor [Zoogloea sp.]MBN8284194.1 TonB-dependent receptor [Zoogloea sp.]
MTSARLLRGLFLVFPFIEAGSAYAGEATLDAITVHTQRVSPGGAPRARPWLRDEVAPVEVCLPDEALRQGATNLNEALDKRPGVAVQVECSICNARFISLNNLPGRYTTLLIDGVPLFSAVSQAYGLDSVGLRGVERIELMRGAGASGLTGEALAGTVNIVTRRPTKREGLVEAVAGSFGHRRLDAQIAEPMNGGAVMANVHYNTHHSVDSDGNGVSEYAGYTRKLGGLGFFADDVGGFKLRGRIDAVDEKRGGGALGRDYAAIKASREGNPFDFSRGHHASTFADGWLSPADGSPIRYTDGRAGLSEIIFTERQSAYVVGERRLGESLIGLAAGYARHDQDSFYEGSAYLAGQNQAYLMASLKTPLAGGVWTLQGDFRYEDLRSRATLPDGGRADGLDNYTYRTPGLGVQAYYPLFDDRLEVSFNLRADRHSTYGTQLSPRLNLLWHHDEHSSSRISAGQGYRAPTSYFEQDHGILDTLQIVRATNGVEKSRNLMYTFDWQDGPWKFVGNAHLTRLDNLAWLDVNATDVHGNPISVLRSADQPVKVKGADAQLGYQFFPWLAASAAVELARYDFPVGTLAFARPEKRAYFTLSGDYGSWDFFARATWTAPQDLSRFYYREAPRYNFDGTLKPDRSPAFWTIDMRLQYAISPQWAVFAGVDNLTDFRQTRHDGYLWIDAGGRVDVTQIWGPNRGRFTYVGARFEF